MVSKRELESKLRLARRATDALTADCREAHKEREQANKDRERAELALERIARHYGFYDAYMSKMETWVTNPIYGGRIKLVDRFDPDKLIADLDTINGARAAGEARTRLGIGEVDREGDVEEVPNDG